MSVLPAPEAGPLAAASTGPPTAPAPAQRAPADPLDSAIVEALRSLARAVRSFQLYLPNNPMHVRAVDSARAAFGSVWELTERFELRVNETQLLHDDVVVLSEGDRAGESVPWMFYKDGIRTVELRRGFETHELPRFLGALQTVRAQAGGDEDLVTLFWECDFEYFSYTYEEAGGDGYAAPGAELLRGGAPAGVITSPQDAEADPSRSSTAAPQFARISDFDSTLYFLEDEEIAYLHGSIREEFISDLRPSVVAALLDTFEMQTDPTVREEICGILEGFMLVLLTDLQFRAAALLIRECSVATARASDVLPSHRQRIGELAGRISEPATLNQLLDVLEDTALKPPQQDLVTLMSQLRPDALRALVARLVRSRNPELRALLESVVTRIASANTDELMRLIGVEDESVSLEAMRRAGDIGSPAAVGPLAAVLDAPSDATRAAAVAALAQIGSPGAMQALERALDDADRDIRLAAVKACAERQHRGALPRLERAIRDRLLHDGSTAEKNAFFDAYATLGGEASVTLLESILLPRGILARKQDPATRASAAMALGRLGTPRALDAVRTAAGDREIVVRSAVARSLRDGGAAP